MESKYLFSFQKESWRNNPFCYNSHTIHCSNKLNTVWRKYSKTPSETISMVFNRYKGITWILLSWIKLSLSTDYLSTSSLNQYFPLLNSLKNTSLPKQISLSQEKVPNSEIPTAFNKYFAGIFNVDSLIDFNLWCSEIGFCFRFWIQFFYHIWIYES